MSETAPVIVFDGVCLLCNRWVDFILRHDRANGFRLAAMQGHHGSRLLHAHGLSPDDPTSLLLVQDGEGYTDTDAIIRILHALGRQWKIAGAVLWLVPRFLRDSAYRWLAKNRYRLFGRRDLCRMPDPAHAARFLD